MISVFAGLPDNKITKRYRVVPGKSIHAEHGLSFQVTSKFMYLFQVDMFLGFFHFHT